MKENDRWLVLNGIFETCKDRIDSEEIKTLV